MDRRSLLKVIAALPLLAPRLGWSGVDAGQLVFGVLPPPERIRRIYVAGPAAAILLTALAPDRMLGWTAAPSTEALAFLPALVQKLPVLGRLMGRGSTMPIETLLSLRPDLILDVGSVNAHYTTLAERVSTQTGIPFLLIDGKLSDSARQLRELGRVLGASARADKLAAYCDRLSALVTRISGAEGPRIYYGRGSDGLETGGEGSGHLEAIDFVGGRNVAAGAGKGGLTHVSMEQVLAWNPEIILTQDESFFRNLRADSAWRSVAAVRQRKVYKAPALPFGWLDYPPGINRLMGVCWLLEKLYPSVERASLAAETRTFYRLFYGKEPTRGQLQTLLQHA